MATTEASGTAALYRLLSWLSPSFPVGAYSYSHGLEWAVEVGDISDAGSLADWIEDVLQLGGAWSDAVVLAQVWRAAEKKQWAKTAEIAELSLAFLPSRERRLESVAQGEAFAEAAETAWRISGFAALRKAWPNPVTYPVAVAVAVAEASIPLGMALPAYLHANAANLISAGVRLIPLGQTDGQRVQVKLEAVVDRVARAAMTSDLEDLGGAAFRSDLASLAHETQYTRLFRS